jgi:amidase
VIEHVSGDSITDLDAHALSRAVHAGEVSCVEVMRAYLARIHRLNPRFNAIVNLADDEPLVAQAAQRDAELARGASRGWMHGMPQAIKDAPSATACNHLWQRAAEGQRGTCRQRDGRAHEGGRLHRDRRPTCRSWPRLAHLQQPLRRHGRLGSELSAGGSSGGAAVCLAQRLLPVADGSDFMGSLRNPGAWNHVFGMRPSQGRVPLWPVADAWIAQLGTEGPMARSVRDLASLLSIQAGHDPRSPLSIAQGPQDFSPRAPISLRGTRIAWLGDLGGHLALEPGIAQVCERALGLMAAEGALVEPVSSIGVDLDRVWQAWLVWRRMLVAPRVGAALAQPGATRDHIKPEALWSTTRRKR